MDLNNQVCSLEQAKKFDQIELVLDPIWYWEKSKDEIVPPRLIRGYPTFSRRSLEVAYKLVYNIYPAYTVAELGVLLKDKQDFIFRSFWCDNCESWAYSIEIGFYSDYPGIMEEASGFDTEAQARAAALIWLLEEKHLKAEDLKL